MKDMNYKKNNFPINILIIGTGMYVCGRGVDGYGTILPAIYEWKKQQGLAEVNIYIAGVHHDGIETVKEKVQELNRLYGYEIRPEYFPDTKTSNPQAYREAIDNIPKPACAIVVIPDNLHRKVAGDTIKNGLHTLVAKPLAPTAREVFELVELQKKHNVYCAVEFHKRFDRSNLMLRDTIADGKFGNPLYFIVEYSQRKSIPRERFKEWVETTNVFQYLGVHYVDIIYFATGACPIRVMAVGQKTFLVSQGIDTYDSIQAVINWKMPSGTEFTSSFFTNWVDPELTTAMSDQKIKVVGTKGRFEADQKKRGIFMINNETGAEEPNPDFCSMYGSEKDGISFKGYGIDSIMHFFNDVSLIESGVLKIEDLEDKRPTFKNAIVPTIILEAVNRSLEENGRWLYAKFNDNIFLGFE
jgi:predicted dehydrogenase